MVKDKSLRRKIAHIIDDLPEPSLVELSSFLEYLQFRNARRSAEAEPPYTPVAIGGLWQGVQISDDDLDEARHEMWGALGERGL